MHQSLLVKSPVLTQRSIYFPSHPSVHNCNGDGSAKMPLVEEGEDLVPCLESSNTCADRFNCAGSIGGRDNAVFDWEWVFALGEHVSSWC